MRGSRKNEDSRRMADAGGDGEGIAKGFLGTRGCKKALTGFYGEEG